jgi:hypothetical protein
MISPIQFIHRITFTYYVHFYIYTIQKINMRNSRSQYYITDLPSQDSIPNLFNVDLIYSALRVSLH